MARSQRPVGGEVQSDGDCVRCDREGVGLRDGTLCERCHGGVWADVVDGVMQFVVLHAETGETMGVGQACPPPSGQATLAWLTEVRSVGVYDSLDDVQEMVRGNENLRMAYF